MTTSHIPALHLLSNMGYQYLTPSETLKLRGQNKNKCLLEPVLTEWFQKNNFIVHNNKEIPFNRHDVRQAVDAIARLPYHNLLESNEQIYDLLILGKSLQQTTVVGIKLPQVYYINWKEPEKNIYHVTDEFKVERTHSNKTRKPDIVLFVNGIPLVIIECKRPGLGQDAIKEGISQHLRNQKRNEIPELYTFSQILMSIAQNSAKFATTATSEEFWSTWREENVEEQEKKLKILVNKSLSSKVKRDIFSEKQDSIIEEMERLWASGERYPSDQDHHIYSLLRPERLLELIQRFVIFDKRQKKICRYQQYFAVKATLKRIINVRGDSKRKGGVIWHTTGSGKSLTMVMMAKAIASEDSIKNPRLLLVTDRVNLDRQIYKTFIACGKGHDLEKARSGTHLISLLKEGKKSIITTIIDKFESAGKSRKFKTESNNIFVLVDESHRSQYGVGHARMINMIPKGCYIGFTGTPLLKQDKSTAQRFGGFIHKYTMNQAVKDGAVVLLIYEGRMSELRGDKDKLDKWFERITQGLTDQQKADLKTKFNREEEVLTTDQRLMEIAYDIQNHFNDNFKNTDFKGQLACSSKKNAIKYKKCFDELGEIKTKIIISPPDTREGHTDIDEKNISEVQKFWEEMMNQYGNESKYTESIIEAFKESEHPQIIIVVDKLLTGFDAPRNTVLYVDKRLKDHNILQAIARVNRVFEGKPHGLIVDYRGIFGDLNDAVDTYAALENEGFDREDIKGTIINTDEEIRELANLHTNVWEIFNAVRNKADTESLQRFLEPIDLRKDFYKRLALFSRTWQLASGNIRFQNEVSEEKKNKYRADLKVFVELRAAVKQRYGETTDNSNYEQQLRNMLNKFVSTDQVKVIIPPTDIFQDEAFDSEINAIQGDAARADTIAHRIKRKISENMEENPALYKKLSEIIEQTISDHKEKRLSDAEYFEEMKKVLNEVRGRDKSVYPENIRNNDDAKAYFGVLREKISVNNDIISDIAIEIFNIIEDHKIRDWIYNQDVQNAMDIDIEEVLFRFKSKYDIDLPTGVIEGIIETLIMVAKRRDS